jgi:heme exporter protein D
MGGFSSFLAMGGYGAYVWPAYGVALGVLGALAWTTWRARRAAKAELARRGLDRSAARGGAA